MNTERFGESESFRKLNLSLRTPKVSNVYDFPVNHGPAWRSSPDERSGQIAFSDWQGSMRGHTPIASADNTVNDGIGCFTQPGGILCDHIQDGLNIRRRTGDDTKYFGRRRLLLQRLFKLIEQPHVLNGDHRLIGEGFEQLDLSLCERTDFRPANLNRTDCETITQQRRCQHSAKAGCYTEGLGPWELGFGCSEIMDVDRLPINDGPSRWRIASNRVSLAPG